MATRRVPIRTPFFYGWLVVVVGGLVSFAEVAFFQPILAVFILPLQAEFGWSRATIAGAIGLGSIVGGLSSPISGPIIDRWGGRWVMAGAGLIMAASLIGVAQAQNIAAFYILFVIGRAATVGVMGLAASVTVSNWFIRNRGPAVSLMHLGTRIGQGTVPIAVALIVASAGWRPAFVAMAIMILVIAVVPSLVLLRRRPEDVGLNPDGAAPLRSTGIQIEIEEEWGAKEAVRTRTFWMLIAATSISFMAGAAVQLHLIPYIQDRGSSLATAVAVQSLLSLIGAPGGVIGGFVQRSIGNKRTFAISLLGHAAGMYLLLIAGDTTTTFVFAIVYGLFHGMSLTMHTVIFAGYFGRRSLGAIRGLASPIQLGLNALGPVLAGVAFDITGSYFLAFAGFAMLYVVAAVIILFVTQPSRPVLRPATVSSV